MKRVTQLAGLRELLDSKDPEGILIGYRAVLDLNPAITPAMVEKLLGSRCVMRFCCGSSWCCDCVAAGRAVLDLKPAIRPAMADKRLSSRCGKWAEE
jgi:hypothetical protein